MGPDELEQYMALKDQCTDIASEIYPHCKDTYPCGVRKSTALDLELSEEARAVKTRLRWFENIFERLLKLQTRIASSASGPVSGNLQSPGSRPQHSSSAKAHAAPPVSPEPPVRSVPMPPVPPPPPEFVARRNRSTGENPTDRINLEILHPRNMAQGKTVAPKTACGRF